MNLIVISLILTSLLTFNLQGPSKVIKIIHWKDEPAEIVSVKLRGRTINPGDTISSYPNWPKELEITVKNVSEKPITFVSLFMLAMNDSRSDSISTTVYSFGSIPGGDGVVQYLQPNQTAVLTHQGTVGDVLDPHTAEISLDSVYWNNNKSVKWKTGRMYRQVSDRAYEPMPEP
ncbi:MAG TPA: hypothetical protein VFD63_18955 [Pyrinomonadaceae bacterium]|nr:hypothetical protein [Pyrinomonadaceae bacterium]